MSEGWDNTSVGLCYETAMYFKGYICAPHVVCICFSWVVCVFRFLMLRKHTVLNVICFPFECKLTAYFWAKIIYEVSKTILFKCALCKVAWMTHCVWHHRNGWREQMSYWITNERDDFTKCSKLFVKMNREPCL